MPSNLAKLYLLQLVDMPTQGPPYYSEQALDTLRRTQLFQHGDKHSEVHTIRSERSRCMQSPNETSWYDSKIAQYSQFSCERQLDHPLVRLICWVLTEAAGSHQ